MRRHALIFAAAAAAALVPALAEAQSRPSTTRMSCAGARTLVAQRGAIVLGTGPSLYDRYVSSQGFCQPDEITKPAWAPTADNRQCFIGYRCERVDDEWPF